MTGRPLSLARFSIYISLSVFVVVALLVVSPGFGSSPIGIVEAWRSWSQPERDVHYIAFQLRMPQTILALMAGASLALCGAVFQTLFRNVLATPYTLGIASGGALGALIAIKCGLTFVFLGFGGDVWCAFAGAGLVVGLVLGATRRRGAVSGNTLILGGVTIGLFCSAMMMFVTYLSDVKETFFIVRWMMGGIDTIGWSELVRMLGPLSVAFIVLLYSSRALNQFELGDEIAQSRGVHTGRLRWVCIVFASLATASVVALCGPIGFVGLIVPHGVRLVVGRDHRLLLPCAALWGGAFLIVCDWLRKLLPVWFASLIGREVSAFPLPIGVMTAVIGAPVFVFMLWRKRSV